MRNLPGYLEYFYYDVLGGDTDITIKKMFGGYGIFKDKKIFALYADDELYFRKNKFITGNRQFFYMRAKRKIPLPYFMIGESSLEDREMLEKYMQASLDY